MSYSSLLSLIHLLHWIFRTKNIFFWKWIFPSYLEIWYIINYIYNINLSKYFLLINILNIDITFAGNFWPQILDICIFASWDIFFSVCAFLKNWTFFKGTFLSMITEWIGIELDVAMAKERIAKVLFSNQVWVQVLASAF